jgi:hypothetical protein
MDGHRRCGPVPVKLLQQRQLNFPIIPRNVRPQTGSVTLVFFECVYTCLQVKSREEPYITQMPGTRRKFSHLFGQLFGRTFGRLFGHLFSRTFGRFFGHLFGRTFGQTFGRTFKRTGGRMMSDVWSDIHSEKWSVM